PHDGNERKQELAVRKAVRRAVAADHGRQEIRRAELLDQSAALAVLRGDVLGTSLVQARVNLLRNARGNRGINERRDGGLGIVGSARLDGGQALGNRGGNLLVVRRHPYAARIDARPPAVLDDRRDDQIEVVTPVRDAVGADEQLAVAGPVQLDARIARHRADGTDVAEEHAAAGRAHDLAGAGVTARIETERLARHADFDERL